MDGLGRFVQAPHAHQNLYCRIWPCTPPVVITLERTQLVLLNICGSMCDICACCPGHAWQRWRAATIAIITTPSRCHNLLPTTASAPFMLHPTLQSIHASCYSSQSGGCNVGDRHSDDLLAVEHVQPSSEYGRLGTARQRWIHVVPLTRRARLRPSNQLPPYEAQNANYFLKSHWTRFQERGAECPEVASTLYRSS